MRIDNQKELKQYFWILWLLKTTPKAINECKRAKHKTTIRQAVKEFYKRKTFTTVYKSESYAIFKVKAENFNNSVELDLPASKISVIKKDIVYQNGDKYIYLFVAILD